jgi:hypothetical protein
VVGRAEGQVAYQADDGLHQRPAGGGMHEADNGGQAALQTDSILRYLALRMPASRRLDTK